MSRNVSAATLRACLAQETGEVFLMCLRVHHPSITELYLVNDINPAVRTDATYQPYPFAVNMPDEDSDSFPQLSLQFDNIDRSVSQTLLALNGQATIEIDVVLASQPNVVEAGPLIFTCISATVTAQTITLTLSVDDDILSQNCPGTTYTPTNSAGLF